MIKNIIREVAPEAADFSSYFEGDCFRDYDGNHFNYNLFIISQEGYNRIYGINIDDYKRVREKAESIIDGFADPEYNETADPDEVVTDYDDNPITYEMIMDDENISHDKRDALVKWYKADPDINDTDDIADFLTITTGEKWSTTSASGYCQGDYVEIVYCKSAYTKEQAHEAGEVYVGAATEFCVIDLDEDGTEQNTVYGYIIADSEARNDEDYKNMVCNWACIDPEETRIEFIETSYTTIHYSYRTA